MLCVPWQVERPGSFALKECEFVATPSLQRRNIDLDDSKEKVGVFKAKHGDAKWKAQVANVDRRIDFQNVTDKPISRAYFKLIEIVRTAAIDTPTTSLHLCEAPGGFAQAALTEYPRLNSASVMSLLSEGMPYFSPILLHNSRCNRLQLDRSGNILDHEVRDQIVRQAQGAELITADGAIDNDTQPELSESSTAIIVACEIETALRAQRNGGNFIVKIFGLTLPITKQLVAILAEAYKTVSIVKPHTSRSVNDERYVVCQGFEGAKAPAFRVPAAFPKNRFLDHVALVDDEWIKEVDAIADQMAAAQRLAIESALKSTSRDETSNGRGGRRAVRGPPTQRGGRSYPYRGKGRGQPKNHTS